MKYMKAIIIDDETYSIGILKKLLDRYCPQVQVVAECSHAETGKQQILKLQPDLVFLDIAMPGKSGLDMLEEMDEMDEINFEIIFVTAYNEYAIRAFHYSATDYLIKPVDEEQLITAVQRVDKKLSGPRRQDDIAVLTHNLKHPGDTLHMKLCIPTIKGFQVIGVNDILYCEADKSYTIFHLSGGHKICSAKPLVDYELLLTDSFFLRTHRSFLINLNYVKEYQRGDGGIVVMTDDTEIEISRRRKDIFLEKVKTLFRQ
jgi:two-component system, LytTR family, response regulator